MLVDERNGEIELDAGFKTSRDVVLKRVVEEVLVGKCGFAYRNILFYGFGQGGMTALDTVFAKSDVEFGGVVSVGGRLSSSSISSSSIDSSDGIRKKKSSTPVLVLGGSRSTQVTRSAVDGLKERFSDVEYVKWVKGEDSMPRSREEMLPIMKFFARRLRSRAGVPEGAVEV